MDTIDKYLTEKKGIKCPECKKGMMNPVMIEPARTKSGKSDPIYQCSKCYATMPRSEIKKR